MARKKLPGTTFRFLRDVTWAPDTVDRPAPQTWKAGDVVEADLHGDTAILRLPRPDPRTRGTMTYFVSLRVGRDVEVVTAEPIAAPAPPREERGRLDAWGLR